MTDAMLKHTAGEQDHFVSIHLIVQSRRKIYTFFFVEFFIYFLNTQEQYIAAYQFSDVVAALVLLFFFLLFFYNILNRVKSENDTFCFWHCPP